MTQILPHAPLPAADESQGPYNGPLSTYREWHTLAFGVIVGALVGWSRTLRHDLRREPHYALAGALVAALVAFAFRQR
jgi:hypothetical protein